MRTLTNDNAQNRAGINNNIQKSNFVTFENDKTVRPTKQPDRCLTISSDQTRLSDRERANPPQYAMFWD